MNSKPKIMVLDNDVVEILSNDNLRYKPIMVRWTNYSNERYEMRLDENELKGLADFFKSYTP